MRRLHLLVLASLLCGLSTSPAPAQNVTIGGWGSQGPPRHGGGVRGGHGFGVPFFYPDREVVVVEREVIREVPAAAGNSGTPNTDVPELPRKPYKIGASYASLPGGCMKMVEAGGSYFYCSGEWYRQVGSAYRAVKEP